MPPSELYAKQSPFSDPGPYAGLLDALPADIGGISAAVRNVIVHYRAPDVTLPPERMAEIDNRWIDRLLRTDQGRFPGALDRPRPVDERVAGCCRDFTLLTVAALRQHGIPARSRIGFASYLAPDFHCDHVVTDYWNGERWVFADAELDPSEDWGFDPLDMPRLVGASPAATPPFETAAQVWTAFRKGEIDDQGYGVDPDLPLRGGWFIRGYVLAELAHRRTDELLLWDVWGDRGDGTLDGDLGLVDEVAALLLAADDGDEAAEHELADRYAHDPRLNPAGRVECLSPTDNHRWVDLQTRAETPA